jgi:hypothetical protein
VRGQREERDDRGRHRDRPQPDDAVPTAGRVA